MGPRISEVLDVGGLLGDFRLRVCWVSAEMLGQDLHLHRQACRLLRNRKGLENRTKPVSPDSCAPLDLCLFILPARDIGPGAVGGIFIASSGEPPAFELWVEALGSGSLGLDGWRCCARNAKPGSFGFKLCAALWHLRPRPAYDKHCHCLIASRRSIAKKTTTTKLAAPIVWKPVRPGIRVWEPFGRNRRPDPSACETT